MRTIAMIGMSGMGGLLSMGLNVLRAPSLDAPILRQSPPRPGEGRRSRSRSAYSGRELREIRASSTRFDGQPRRECARRLRQMGAANG